MRPFLFAILSCITLFSYSQNTGIRYYDTTLTFADLTVRANGNIILTGHTGDSLMLLETDPLGNPLGVKTYHGIVIDPFSPLSGTTQAMTGKHIVEQQGGTYTVIGSIENYLGAPVSDDMFFLDLDHDLDTIAPIRMMTFFTTSYSKGLRVALPNSTGSDVLVGGSRWAIQAPHPILNFGEISAAGMNGGVKDGDRNASGSVFITYFYDGWNSVPGPFSLLRLNASDSLAGATCFQPVSPTSMNGTGTAAVALAPDSACYVYLPYGTASNEGRLVKLNYSLDTLWSKKLDLGFSISVKDMQVRANGKPLLLVEHASTGLYLMQCSVDGTFEWLQSYSGVNSVLHTATSLHLLENDVGYLIMGNDVDGPFLIRTDTFGAAGSCSQLSAGPLIVSAAVGLDPACATYTSGSPWVVFQQPALAMRKAIDYVSPPNDCGVFQAANKATGLVFYDADQDKVFDPDEYELPFFPTQIQPNGYTLYTGTGGQYAFTAPDGGYSVNIQTPPSPWALSTDSTSYSFTFTPTDSLFENLDFGLYPTMDTTILDANFIIQNVPCGAPAQRQVLLNNNGTTVDSGQVILVLDTAFTSVSSTMADSVVGNAIYFDFDTLYPQQTMQLLYNATEPPWAAQGDPMLNELSVLVNDSTGTLQTYSVEMMNDTVNCGCDPNDKLVDPSGEGPVHAIDHDTQELDYTIRFQNTGTDTAYTVIVKDQFPSELIVSSFQFNGSSHDVTGMSLTPSGFLQVEFANILLPDSNVNLQGSKGWISFTVDLEQGLPHLREVKNNAAIYFDLNDPVITNTALLTIRNCDQAGLPDTLFFNQQGPSLGIQVNFIVFDYDYQWFFNGVALPNDTSTVIGPTSSGDYHVTITDITGCVQHTDTFFFSVTGVSGQEESTMAVYPNPFSDQTLLIFDKVFSSTDLIEVYDLHGRLVKKVRGNGSRKLVLTNEEMHAGMYLVRLTRSGVQAGTQRIVLQ